MPYYILRCGGHEEMVAKDLNEVFGRIDSTAIVLFPKKIMIEKHAHFTLNVERPLIPGYLLMYGEAPLSDLKDALKYMRGTQYIIHYPASEHYIYELKEKDKAFATWVFTYDGLIKPSKAIMKPGQSIKIIEGPLKGMAGYIYRVCRRGNRVTVAVPFGETEMKATVAVDFVEAEK